MRPPRPSIGRHPDARCYRERVSDPDFPDEQVPAIEWKLRAAAIPGALLVALLFFLSPLGHAVQRTFLTMIPHEPATPSPGGTWSATPSLPWKMMIREQRSIIVACSSMPIAFIAYRAWRTDRLVIVTIAALLGAGIFVATTTSAATASTAFTFGGDGGALVIGTLLVLSFFPPRARAGGLRWGLLVIGAATTVDRDDLVAVRRNSDAIPYVIEGVGLSDPTKLVEVYVLERAADDRPLSHPRRRVPRRDPRRLAPGRDVHDAPARSVRSIDLIPTQADPEWTPRSPRSFRDRRAGRADRRARRAHRCRHPSPDHEHPAFDQSAGWHQGARAPPSGSRGASAGTAAARASTCASRTASPCSAHRRRSFRLARSPAKVRALIRVATPANEDLLLVDAQHATGIQLETICRKYASVARRSRPTREADAAARCPHHYDREDGLVGITAVLLPEEAAAVWAALDQVARERTNGGRPSRPDALVSLAEGVLRGDRPDRSPTELVITVAAEVLDGSAPDAPQVATTANGIAVSAETTRRLACDCGVVHVTEDANGVPLSVGRKTRSIPSSIKRALIKRDTCCRFPGCTNRLYVDGHHIQHWAHGGETALDNLVLVCTFHHRFVHEYGYAVQLDATREPGFFDPRGRPVTAVPEPARPPKLGLAAITRANAELSITPSTNAPRWDGEPVNYDWVIEDLCRRDPAPDPLGSSPVP